MRTIGQFVTEDLKQLSTQLGEFEQNVVKETASIRRSFQLSQPAEDDDPVSPRKTYTVGQCARVDTTGGTVVLNLAASADGLPGEVIVVQRAGTAGFVAVGISAKINGAADAPFGAFPFAVVTRFYFDGTDFWS